MLAWHGTNQSFDAFEERFLGLSNSNSASRAAFFFSVSPETAWSYAASAARSLVPDHEKHEMEVARYLKMIDQAMRRGDHDLSERLSLELEELEMGAIHAPPSGERLLKCELSFENPVFIDGMSHASVVNLGAVIEAAWKEGHDAVIIENIADTPCGSQMPDTHIAIRSSEQIHILDVLYDLPCDMTHDEPEFSM